MVDIEIKTYANWSPVSRGGRDDAKRSSQAFKMAVKMAAKEETFCLRTQEFPTRWKMNRSNSSFSVPDKQRNVF